MKVFNVLMALYGLAMSLPWWAAVNSVLDGNLPLSTNITQMSAIYTAQVFPFFCLVWLFFALYTINNKE